MSSTSSSGTTTSDQGEWLEVKEGKIVPPSKGGTKKLKGGQPRVQAQSNVVISTGIPAVSVTGSKVPEINVVTMGEDVPSNLTVVSKEQLVDTFVWNTTHVTGQVMKYYDNPFGLIKNKVMSNAFSQYQYYKGTAVLRLFIQSNQYQSGAVALSFAPLQNIDQALRIYNGSITSVTAAPHILAFGGRNQSVELRVPFNHPQDYLSLVSDNVFNTCGTFLVSCMTPLRVGPTAASTSVTISVFARFEDTSFQVINPLVDSLVTTKAVAQGGVQSSVSNYNFQNAAISGTVDAKKGNDQFRGGDSSATVPCDKPNWGINPLPQQPRPYPTVATAVNIEFGQVLDLQTGALASTAETGFGVDEMDFRMMTSCFTYFDSFVVSNTIVIGQSVYKNEICPGSETADVAEGDIFQPSLLTYVSLPFSYWRGAIRYKLIAVASPVHSLRLQICSHIGFDADGLTVNQAFGQYTCVFDVNGTSTVIVEFPYRSPTRLKKVMNGSYSDNSPFSMGQFSVRVLNPLQAPEIVSPVIDVMVFIAGGADYQVSHLSTNATDFTVYNQ